MASINPGILVFEMVYVKRGYNILVEGGTDERKITANFLDSLVDLDAGDSCDHQCSSSERELDYFLSYFAGRSRKFIPEFH
jgi:hypothetical protein